MKHYLVMNKYNNLTGERYNELRNAMESDQLDTGTQRSRGYLVVEQLTITRKSISGTYSQLSYENLLVSKVCKGAAIPSTPRRRGQLAEK